MATLFGVNKTAVVNMLSTDLAAAIAQGARATIRLLTSAPHLRLAELTWPRRAGALAGTAPAETVITLLPVALGSLSRCA